MPEINSLISSYSHLADYPKANDALLMLKKIASLVKPIMRAHGFKVGLLVEFYPEQNNLLGLNVGSGQRICLRLRSHYDRKTFLEFDRIVDTMLHELAHNECGPHDAKFHALWNQLRDEHEGLKAKGYTGEGFLTDGHRLGGRRIPREEAQRLARAAAEKRRVLNAGSGQKLGGIPPRAGTDIRRVIVDAIERRSTTMEGCANDKHRPDEIIEIANTATRNGFRTQAEEDAANEAAIAQALWELVQEDEKAKLGDAYVPPTAINQIETNGPGLHTLGPRPPRSEPPKNGLRTYSGDSKLIPPKNQDPWICQICTLENPSHYLCCDVCGTERTGPITKNTQDLNARAGKRQRTTIDLTKDDTGAGRGSQQPPKAEKMPTTSDRKDPSTASTPRTWTCSFCGRVREQQWWSCDLCGKIKASS